MILGYPYALPKKFLRGFVRIPGVVLEASGGSNPPNSPDLATEQLQFAVANCASVV
jgi:hypothetical protein